MCQPDCQLSHCICQRGCQLSQTHFRETLKCHKLCIIISIRLSDCQLSQSLHISPRLSGVTNTARFCQIVNCHKHYVCQRDCQLSQIMHDVSVTLSNAAADTAFFCDIEADYNFPRKKLIGDCRRERASGKEQD